MFAAIARDDTAREVESMAAKVLNFKMWPSKEEKGAPSVGRHS